MSDYCEKPEVSRPYRYAQYQELSAYIDSGIDSAVSKAMRSFSPDFSSVEAYLRSAARLRGKIGNTVNEACNISMSSK